MSSEEGETIVLRSSDNETFQISEKVAKQSKTIEHMIDDDCADAEIPLPRVTGKILSMVIEFCKKSVEEGVGAADRKKYEAEFVKLEERTLLELILAANYLDIATLMDVTCQAAADYIKDKQPDEVRQIFNLDNDFTPQEEAQLREENAWAFQ